MPVIIYYYVYDVFAHRNDNKRIPGWNEGGKHTKTMPKKNEHKALRVLPLRNACMYEICFMTKSKIDILHMPFA